MDILNILNRNTLNSNRFLKSTWIFFYENTLVSPIKLHLIQNTRKSMKSYIQNRFLKSNVDFWFVFGVIQKSKVDFEIKFGGFRKSSLFYNFDLMKLRFFMDFGNPRWILNSISGSQNSRGSWNTQDLKPEIATIKSLIGLSLSFEILGLRSSWDQVLQMARHITDAIIYLEVENESWVSFKVRCC